MWAASHWGLGWPCFLSSLHSRGGVPWTAVLLVHAVFLFDATFTIIKRFWRRENITSPHREHNYQLLVRCGWSHVTTTMAVLMLSTGSCLAAFCYARFAGPIQWSALVATAAGLTAYAVIAHTGGRLPGRSRPSMSPWRTRWSAALLAGHSFSAVVRCRLSSNASTWGSSRGTSVILDHGRADRAVGGRPGWLCRAPRRHLRATRSIVHTQDPNAA